MDRQEKGGNQKERERENQEREKNIRRERVIEEEKEQEREREIGREKENNIECICRQLSEIERNRYKEEEKIENEGKREKKLK